MMIPRAFFALSAALCSAIMPASAQVSPSGPRTTPVIGKVSATYIGPGDLLTFTAWYSCARAYSGAVAAAGTQKMCRIRNTTSNEQCDIIVATSGGQSNVANCSSTSNGVSVSTLCGAADCAIVTIYNQAGTTPCAGSTSCDVTQATAGNQPVLLASDSYRSGKSTGSTAKKLISANNYTANVAAQITMTGVGQRIAAASNDTGSYIAAAGNFLSGSSSGAGLWATGGGGTPQTRSAADSAWHTAVGVVKTGGSNSGLCVATSGCTFGASGTSVSGAAAVVTIMNLSNASNSTLWRESGWIDNFAATPTQAHSYNLQSSTYYSFTPP